MFQHHGWWFPDEETHFPKMLDKSVNKGLPPVYQENARKRSIALTPVKKLALDIGANVGLWSRDLCASFDQVMAFEPVPKFRDCLIKNVTAPNLFVQEIALGNEETWATMNITPDNTGHSHIDPESIGRGDTQVRRLDNLALDNVNYIKVDCEGYEYKVLLGAEQTIKRCRPVLVIEQKPHDAYSKEYGQFAAIELLTGWGMVKLEQVKDDWIMGWI